MFNTLLDKAGLEVADVRLVRHKDNKADRGRTPYDLWCNDREQFERYHSVQGFHKRTICTAPYWAVFLGTPSDETLFVGLYGVEYLGKLKKSHPVPSRKGEVDKAGTADEYHLTLLSILEEFIGKLIIDWGPGALAFVQHAHRNDKQVIELRQEFKEPDFPGFNSVLLSFSMLRSIIRQGNPSWKAALSNVAGVYVICDIETGYQYVGSAYGGVGLWQRWAEYASNRHGGNKELRRLLRDEGEEYPENFQFALLEVCDINASPDYVISRECHWKEVLLSREFGYNDN